VNKHIATINKQTFLATLTCPTYGWLLRQNQIPEDISLSAQLRIDQGLEIHQRARCIFPQGIYIDERNIETAAERTAQLINSNTPVIYEASFIVDNFRTKADILKREKSGWHLFEIKSSLNTTQDLIDDITYTSMVVRRAGLNVVKYSLNWKSHSNFLYVCWWAEIYISSSGSQRPSNL